LLAGGDIAYVALVNLDMNTESVKVSVADGVAVVTLERPAARNAWDDSLGAGMESVFGGLAALQEVRSVVLTGSGTVFCAGADLPTATTICARRSGTGSTPVSSRSSTCRSQ
jgi:enoyl-CoA hydratase/carnithine racemase